MAAPSPSRLSAYWKSATVTPAVSTTIVHAAAIGMRRESRAAIAAHGVNHPAYWREKTGEHAHRAHRDERRDPEKVLPSRPECLPPDGAEEDHEHHRPKRKRGRLHPWSLGMT